MRTCGVVGRGSSEYVKALKTVNPYRISLYLHCNCGAKSIYGSGEDRPDYVDTSWSLKEKELGRVGEAGNQMESCQIVQDASESSGFVSK